MLPTRPDCHLVLHHNGKNTPLNRNVTARLAANALTCCDQKGHPKAAFEIFESTLTIRRISSVRVRILFRINKAPPSRFRVIRRKNGFHVAQGGQQAQAVAQQFTALFHHVFHYPVITVQHQRLPQRAHAEQA